MKKTITLPLEYFLEILFQNHPSYFPSRYCSIREGAQDIPPAMCRYEIGVLLKEIDKEERVKVFLYPATMHAEVWDLRTWLDSTTHRLESKEEQQKYAEESYERERRLQERFDNIEKIFKVLDNYLPKATARYYAERIVDTGSWETIKPIIERTFGNIE